MLESLAVDLDRAKHVGQRNNPVLAISSATGEGISELLREIGQILFEIGPASLD